MGHPFRVARLSRGSRLTPRLAWFSATVTASPVPGSPSASPRPGDLRVTGSAPFGQLRRTQRGSNQRPTGAKEPVANALPLPLSPPRLPGSLDREFAIPDGLGTGPRIDPAVFRRLVPERLGHQSLAANRHRHNPHWPGRVERDPAIAGDLSPWAGRLDFAVSANPATIAASPLNSLSGKNLHNPSLCALSRSVPRWSHRSRSSASTRNGFWCSPFWRR